MNPVNYILGQIKFLIPAEVLRAAFYRREFGQQVLPTNIDELIRERVIEGRVRQDCDLVGGTETVIPIYDLPYDAWDNYRYCYRIPLSRTNGRYITRTVGVMLGNAGLFNMPYVGGAGYSQVLEASSAVLASNSAIPDVASTDVQLIGPNTILVSNLTTFSSQMHLRCYVENDADFANLRSTALHRFSELCVLATKAYIYNTLKIPMDMGQLVGGMNLGAFKEVVDEYRDSAQLYQDFLLNKWKRIAILNDPMAKKRHVRVLMGGHR